MNDVKFWKVVVEIDSIVLSNNCFLFNIKAKKKEQINQEVKNKINKIFGNVDYKVVNIYEL